MIELNGKNTALGIQHLFAMFGATVLVPMLTGFSPALALVTAGIGTLIFHLCTKGMVPVFVGSSFAFIGAVSLAVQAKGIPYAQGGIVAAGAVYLLFSVLARSLGQAKIRRFFPPIVTGPIIIVIGIGLSGVGIRDCLNGVDIAGGIDRTAMLNLGIAFFTMCVVLVCSIFLKGFFRLVPILIGLASGYVLCLVLRSCGVFSVDFDSIAAAHWINIPYRSTFVNNFGQTCTFFSLPRFDLGIVLSIAPIALVTFMEHIGDITTNGAVVGRNFFADPGLHRTLLGDGCATIVAGLLGGPANTTYSENTGVLATTKVYDPALLRLAAVFAVVLGMFGKFGAVLQTIPCPVKGGVEVVLFGMIASIGIRTLAEADLDFAHSRNLTIMAVILVTGLGFGAIGGIPVVVSGHSVNVSGLFIATVFGVVLNRIFPATPSEQAKEK